MWYYLIACCLFNVIEVALIIASLYLRKLSYRQHTLTSSPVISQELIGAGSFGKVFPGKYCGESVAIKEFEDFESWKREHSMFESLHHENIVEVISCHLKCSPYSSGVTGVLIMRMYPLGNLASYLKNTTIHNSAVFGFCSSVLSGLEYLHGQGIAHHDLKSTNVLVKSSHSLVLTDLSLSIKQNENGQVDRQLGSRLGTIRYLAPEVLSDQIDVAIFSHHAACDVYSIGLVMWEILNVVSVNGISEEYRLPYSKVVPLQPSFEDMRQVIIVQNHRPTLSQIIMQCLELALLVRVIEKATKTKIERPTVAKLLYLLQNGSCRMYET